MPSFFDPASETIAVIDFEATGLSPATGGRATEIAAVLVRNGQIVDRYASLMQSGARVPRFIEQLTGISNAMLARAPPAERVMREVAAFVGKAPLVAHNAAFDRSFWCAELQRAGREAVQPSPARPKWAELPSARERDDDGEGIPGPSIPRFACTLLLARRLYPESPNHRLGTLAALHRLPSAGRAHRALADAEVTAALLLQMQRDVMQRFAVPVAPHALLVKLQLAARGGLAACVEAHRTQNEPHAAPVSA